MTYLIRKDFSILITGMGATYIVGVVLSLGWGKNLGLLLIGI
jgi:hypothetical protein